SSTAVEWLAIDTVGLRDGWALFTPTEGQFVEGDSVTFTVNASTLSNEAIGPLSYTFTIESESSFLERLGVSDAPIFQPDYTDFDASGLDLSLESNADVSLYALDEAPAS